MQRIIERFDKYMKYKGLNDNKITNNLQLSVGVLGKSRKEGRDLSRHIVEKILNYYTDIRNTWNITSITPVKSILTGVFHLMIGV